MTLPVALPLLRALGRHALSGARRGQAAWRALSRLRAQRRGSVAIIAGVSCMVLIGAAAVALDLAQLYVAKANVQRAADQSALTAALAYVQSGSVQTAATAAAQDLATANGIPSASTYVSATYLPSSPSGDGNPAELVTVSVPITQLPLATAAFHIATETVSASAWAEITDTTECFIALDSSGVTGSGGVALTATGCVVASGGVVTATSGARFTAQAFDAVGTISSSNGGSITTTPTANALVRLTSAPTDPYVNAGAFSRIPTVAALTAPSFPSVGSAPGSGTAENCASGVLLLPYGNYGTVTVGSGCSVVFFTGGTGTTTNIASLSTSSFNGTMLFADGTYNIGGVYIGGTGGVTIDDSSSTAIFNIWNGFSISSGAQASLVFNGPANFNVQGGIQNYGTGTMQFLNTFSSTADTFNVSGGISATHGNISFPDGIYNVSGGIYSESTSVSFGNGSFNIAGGIQFQGGGGSMTFGSALNSNSVFQVPTTTNGYAMYTSGGSSLTIGSFTNLDFNGAVTLSGSATLGAGTYTINGAFVADATGGGSISGTNVSIIASGTIGFGAGYSSVNITAPDTITSSTLGNAATLALASESSSASTVTAGATDTIVLGAIYMPNAALTLAGAGTVTGNGGCTIVVVGSASFSGGGNLTTNCTGVATPEASLVQ